MKVFILAASIICMIFTGLAVCCLWFNKLPAMLYSAKFDRLMHTENINPRTTIIVSTIMSALLIAVLAKLRSNRPKRRGFEALPPQSDAISSSPASVAAVPVVGPPPEARSQDAR